MKKKIFDWTTFLNKNNKIAVHCKTEEEATNFCKMLHEHGLKWCDGHSYLSVTHYNFYKNEMCYTNEGSYSRKNYFIKHNYTILEYSDYNFEPSKSTTESEESKMESIFTIKKVKTINNRVTMVYFKDGDVQKAVCDSQDTFDFERGLEICVMKHILGKSAYYKALKDAEKQIKALEVADQKAKADAELKARKEEKEARRKRARAERKRAARIAEMKEAYLSALKEYNKDNEAKDFSEDKVTFEEILAASENKK